MPANVGNLIIETGAVTGTGDVTLTQFPYYRRFSDEFATGVGNTFYYAIRHRTLYEYEVGIGHLSAASTLVRDSVIQSSNSNNAVDFTVGDKDVICDLPANLHFSRDASLPMLNTNLVTNLNADLWDGQSFGIQGASIANNALMIYDLSQTRWENKDPPNPVGKSTYTLQLDSSGIIWNVVAAPATPTWATVLAQGRTSGGTAPQLSTSDKLEMRDANKYLHSPSSTEVYLVSDGDLRLLVGASSKIYLGANSAFTKSNERLGLNTTSPSGWLHVNSNSTAPHYLVTGTSLDGSSDTTGAIFAMTHNGGTNCQLFVGATVNGLGFRVLGNAMDGYNYQTVARTDLQLMTDTSIMYNPASIASTVDGALWNDSTQKTRSVYQNNLQQQLIGCIFTQTADKTVGNTTSETSILGTGVGTKTLPAAFFVTGKTIRIRGEGYIADTSTPTGRIRVKLGGTTVLDSAAQTLVAITGTNRFEYEILITCRTTGASGTVYGQGDARYYSAALVPNFIQMANTATTTIDTTASQAFDVTWTWGTANAANTITLTNATIEVIN